MSIKTAHTANFNKLDEQENDKVPSANMSRLSASPVNKQEKEVESSIEMKED